MDRSHSGIVGTVMIVQTDLLYLPASNVHHIASRPQIPLEPHHCDQRPSTIVLVAPRLECPTMLQKFQIDPWIFGVPEQWDLTFAGVYRVTPDLGTISLLVDDFVLPNGLVFSPDEKILYVNDSRRGHIRAFDVQGNGLLSKQTDRVFADLRGSEPGVPDGMKVDVEGNVYCGGAGGIWILDPRGKKLGRIIHGWRSTPNVGFGGDDWRTLYFTGPTQLGAVNVRIPGLPLPKRDK